MNFEALRFFVYQKAFIRTFHTSFQANNPLEFTTREHKFKKRFCSQNLFIYVIQNYNEYKVLIII